MKGSSEDIILPAQSSRGVLMIHGFTGSPSEVHALGQFLNQHDFHVSMPLLPGHGVSPNRLNEVTTSDWFACIHESYEDLSKKCDEVYIVGLSMGAVLSMHYLIEQKTDIKGLVALSPIFWIRNRILHSFLSFLDHTGLWSLLPIQEVKKSANAGKELERFAYDVYPFDGLRKLVRLTNELKSKLTQLNVPTFLVHSKADSVIPHESMLTIAEKLSPTPQTLILEEINHVMTADHLAREKEKLFQEVLTFIKECADL